jgi:uncharacterized protein YbjT (DUF2867 family)
MKKITVIGSTGMIGIPVTMELIKAGFDVTALVRNIDKAKQFFPTGVKLVKGDLDDKNSLAEAMKDAEGIYINISTRPDDKENEFNPESNGIDNIIAAAKNSWVKQVVYLSSFLARNYNGDWWVMKAKKAGITKVKNSGLAYTVFYPSNFMENFKHGMVQGKKIMVMGKPINKAWWIAGEDFGRNVANAFKNEKALNKEYPVQGLEAMTLKEAAQSYSHYYTKEKLTVSSMPMGLAKFLAIFVKPLKFVSKLMDVMNNNKETFEAENTWNELGKPEITIERFAKR